MTPSGSRHHRAVGLGDVVGVGRLQARHRALDQPIHQLGGVRVEVGVELVAQRAFASPRLQRLQRVVDGRVERVVEAV